MQSGQRETACSARLRSLFYLLAGHQRSLGRKGEACDRWFAPQFSLRGGISGELMKPGTLSQWKATLGLGWWFSKWGPRTSSGRITWDL